jgi:hypothetical protein
MRMGVAAVRLTGCTKHRLQYCWHWTQALLFVSPVKGHLDCALARPVDPLDPEEARVGD